MNANGLGGISVVVAMLALGGCKEQSQPFAGLFGEPTKAPGAAPPPAAPSASPATAADRTAAADGSTRPFVFEPPAGDAAAPTACEFPALAAAGTFRLYAAGAYSGRRLGYQIDRSGHEATTVDVLVNSPGMPVALMLGNYEPTVWNLGWSEGTQIAAVLVGGYHAQVVTGLPADVPLIVSTYDNRGRCGHFHVSADKPASLNPLARRVFGRPIDMLYPVHEGKVVVGEAPGAGAKLLTDAAARPASSFRLPESLAAGEAGLDYAVRQGWLRPATRADGDAWLAAQAARPRADEPPVAGGRRPASMNVHNGYVVLAAFELPPGLYGAHSATFFVPRGIQRPTGNPGHSAIYDFNTLTCHGAVCGLGE